MTLVRRVFSVLCVFAAVFSTQVFASSLPEWDGVYLRSQDGSYEEMRPVASVRMFFAPDGAASYMTTDYTVIPADKFKGILIKGKDFIGTVLFHPMRRDRELSLADLFRSKKEAKFLDRFTKPINPGFYMPRKRKEGDDGIYFEPSKEPRQFFGAADEGCFVHLIVGNGTYYIFGIGAPVGTEPTASPATTDPERSANAQ